MRASQGTLFLAPCRPPRGACLLLLYFGDTRCMMVSQRWPLTVHMLSNCPPRYGGVSRGGLACSWSGVGCRVGMAPAQLRAPQNQHVWVLRMCDACTSSCPPPSLAFLMAIIMQELLLYLKSSGPKLGLNSGAQLRRQQHFFHLPLIFASKRLHGDRFHFVRRLCHFRSSSLR